MVFHQIVPIVDSRSVSLPLSISFSLLSLFLSLYSLYFLLFTLSVSFSLFPPLSLPPTLSANSLKGSLGRPGRRNTKGGYNGEPRET